MQHHLVRSVFIYFNRYARQKHGNMVREKYTNMCVCVPAIDRFALVCSRNCGLRRDARCSENENGRDNERVHTHTHCHSLAHRLARTLTSIQEKIKKKIKSQRERRTRREESISRRLLNSFGLKIPIVYLIHGRMQPTLR